MAERTIANRYVLDVALGRGGFGEVWRAQDTVLGRQVAIKIVDLTVIGHAPQLADIVARFRREALAVGGLSHANIIGAYDAGQADMTLYLVMELVQGSSLAAMLEDRMDQGLGPMPVPDVIDIATQVCAGLSSAHAAGVVHRDIKPGNLMMDRQRNVKIIDFGIARFLHDDMPRLTAPGAGVGTLSYVAPEQAQGLNVDGRADLYSLGCMLYELLAGVRPFLAQVPAALLNKQLSEQAAPLRTHRPDVPGSLAALITQLMEKEPAARPASAQEVHDRLVVIRRGLEERRLAGPEAARPTIRVADVPAPDAAAAPVAAASASGVQYRPTVLANDSAGYETVDSALLAAQPASREPWLNVPTAPASQAGQPSAFGPFSPAAPPRPPGWGGSGDQPGGGAGLARPGRAERQRHGRRPRGLFLVGLAALAVVAAVVTALALRVHGSGAFTVTAVAVAPSSPPPSHKCDIAVEVVGTIVTNGNGGTVTYQWTRSDGTTSPVQTVQVTSGRKSEQVFLHWTIRGPGSTQAKATLRVLSPSVKAASTSFPYSCR